MRNKSLRLLLPLVLLLMSAMSLTSCYKQETGFTATHHYNQNYNFVVKADSMVIYENPDTAIYDSIIVYRGDQLVVAEIKTISNDTIDSVWVKLARDQMSQGWTRECDLLNGVAPDDPISQFIDLFSNNHLLLFLALVVIVTASYGLRKLYRRDAYIVHFHDISSVLPTMLAILVATSATVYATIQNFAPENWRHFYFHPTLNPFAVMPVIGLFVSLVWALIITGIAVVEDVMRRLPFGSAVLYLLGLAAICAVDYVVFSIFTLYYIGYVLLAAYIWFAVSRLRLVLARYVCGNCGKRIPGLGKCPHCGAVNE
ncbi:MAG: zinc ribbon domain-containing protein [Prevotellaceae bacterium]|nr:zinc ribbon domain-containing protein [Prevotellaceae bacterium]